MVPMFYAHLQICPIKFGLSEKPTKFEKIFLIVLTNQLIYLVNIKTIFKEDFFQIMCASQKVPTLKVNGILQKERNLYQKS